MGLGSSKRARGYVGSGSGGSFQRHPADLYESCPEAIRLLLKVEHFDGLIWEPACGKGAISRELHAAGLETVDTDLFDRGFGTPNVNFLHADIPPGVKHIVTNPPFTGSIAFCERVAWAVRQTGGKGCLLLRLQCLEGLERTAVLKRTRLSRVWVSSRRLPRMHNPDYEGKKGTSMLAFAWFVWDGDYEGPVTIDWVDWKDSEVAGNDGQMSLLDMEGIVV